MSRAASQRQRSSFPISRPRSAGREARPGPRLHRAMPCARARLIKLSPEWPTTRHYLFSPMRSWCLMRKSSQTSRCRTGFLQYLAFENSPIWGVSSPMVRTFATNIGAPLPTWIKFSKVPIQAISRSSSQRASSSTFHGTLKPATAQGSLNARCARYRLLAGAIGSARST